MVLACSGTIGLAQISAVFIGPDGNYLDPARWDIGVVPINAGLTTYDVGIPNWDAIATNAGSFSIDGLSVAQGASFEARDNTQTTVLDPAMISGQVIARFAPSSVTFTSASDVYAGGRLQAIAGGTITSAGTTFQASSGSEDLIADGPGSTVDASSITTITANGAALAEFYSLGAGSLLDLSGLQSSAAPLFVQADGGGIIEFGSLALDPTVLEGGGIIASNGGTVMIPVGVSVRNGSLGIQGNGVLSVPSITDFDGVQIYISDGGSFTMSGTSLDPGESDDVILGARGFDSGLNPSTLDASTIQTVTGPFTVTAEARGEVDLSGLTSVSGPGGAEPCYAFLATSGSIDASGLTSLTGRGVLATSGSEFGLLDIGNVTPTGPLDIEIRDGGELVSTGITSIDGADLTLDGGYTWAVSLASIDGASIQVDDNTTFSPGVSSYTTAGITTYHGTVPRFNARLNSLLEFPNMTSLVFDYEPASTGQPFSILSQNGGVIDCSAVETLTVLNDDLITISASGSGSVVDFSGLTSVSGEISVGASNGGVVIFPEALPGGRGGTLSSLTDASLGIVGTGEIRAETIQTLTNTTITASNGATFAVPVTSYDLAGSGAGTFIDVEDRFSVVSFPLISSLNVLPDTGLPDETVTFIVNDRGLLDLSNLEALAGPPAGGDGDVLRFVVDRQFSLIDLSGLQTASGALSMIALNEGTIDFGADLVVPPEAQFAVRVGARFIARGDLIVQVIDADFDYRVTEGYIHMDGAGEQAFEVAGSDEGLPMPGNDFATTTPTQLAVGSVGNPTTVTLVDTADNGNRGGSAGNAEALYLNGESFNGTPGLTIAEGSTLVLGDLEVYVNEDTNWVRLRDLISPGELCAPYSDGRVCLAVCFADCDGNGALNVDDIDCFVTAFLGGDLSGADCDGNGTLNVDDIDCFVSGFLSGCP